MRRHLVGLFVLFHVSVALLASVPAPDVSAFGPLAPVAEAWDAARGVGRRVSRTYGAYLGPKQSWGMFSGVARRNTRVEVWILDGDGWRPVYVERSAEADWRRRSFDHYRWREFLAVTGGTRERESWDRFVAWVAAEALADFPDASSVRVKRTAAEVPLPSEHARGQRMSFDEVVVNDRVAR